ncbi:immunoglobulin-like domain-containing protein [Clostridium sp.]|uniref:immunoglobulin-like domain-containing protein n=1 Tax=Clostridium sp. TaxID=1506 RepID=UPI003F2B424F
MKRKAKVLIFMPIAILLLGVFIAFKSEDCGKESIYGEINKEEVLKNGIEIYVDNIALSKEKNELELVISNIGDKKISFGVEYAVEKKKNGIWYEVPFREEMMFIEIAKILNPAEISSEIISLDNLKGSLKSGEYRVIKRFYIGGKEVIVAGNFTI